MIGYIFAVISSIFFSLYIIPRKLSKTTPLIFSFYMSLGFSIISIMFFIFKPVLKFNETFTPVLGWSVLAGIIWALSFVAFVKSIDLIGLSRSNQWKNLQGPVGVILSMIILNEITKINPTFTLLAAISIFLSAIFFTKTSELSKKINFPGVSLASLAGFGFGTVAVIQKYVTVNSGIYFQQIVWSISIILTLLVYILIKNNQKELFKISKNDLFLGLIAGAIYFGASLFQLLSYNFIPASIGFTIIQLNTFWIITIGITVFKEINIKKHSKNILLGFLFTALGIVFLFFARK